MAPQPSPLDQLIAQQLRVARELLIDMGDELCGDFAVVSRHTVPLQAIDIVSQMLGHLANVVAADDRAAAVEAIGMAELRARLSEAA